MTLGERAQALRTQVDKAVGYRSAVQARLDETTAEIAELEAEEQVADMVAALFRTLIDQEVHEGVLAIEKLQSEGLQAVFDDMNLFVRADVNVQRGQVSVDLLTVQEQPDGALTEGSSLDVFGGSVASVQSVLMRVIVMLRRDMRPLLLLDESLGAVAENYVPAIGYFLSKLCERLDMDILVVTHNPVLVEAAKATFKEVRRRNG